MKKLILTIASLACVTFSTVVIAQDDMLGEKKSPGVERHSLSFGKMLKDVDLDLSDDQKLEIRAIAQQTRENNSVYRADKQETKDQMRDVMNMPVWDEQFAREIILSQMQRGRQVQLNNAQARHEIYQILTSEQKEALAVKAEQRSDRKATASERKGNKRKARVEARLAKALDLSDDQKSQWAEYKASGKALKESFRDTMQAHKEQVKQLIQADTFDADAFLALQERFEESLLEHRVQMAQTKYASLALLTDEQKQKMEKIKNKMKEKRRS